MRRSLVLALASTALTVAACSQSPARAPGSNPEDMTPEGHAEAAEKEHREAERHEEMADDVESTRPAAQRVEEERHKREANKHHDFGEQHQRAGEAAGDGGARQ